VGQQVVPHRRSSFDHARSAWGGYGLWAHKARWAPWRPTGARAQPEPSGAVRGLPGGMVISGLDGGMRGSILDKRYGALRWPWAKTGYA
jgi:hypothetical protein